MFAHANRSATVDVFVSACAVSIPYPSLAASVEAHSTGSCADETVDADAAGSSKTDTYGGKQVNITSW
jgi:hypothetical protein